MTMATSLLSFDQLEECDLTVASYLHSVPCVVAEDDDEEYEEEYEEEDDDELEEDEEWVYEDEESEDEEPDEDEAEFETVPETKSSSKHSPSTSPAKNPPAPKGVNRSSSVQAKTANKNETFVPISSSLVGWVIGKGGQRIRDMMEASGAKIWVDQEKVKGQQLGEGIHSLQ